jgi:hypothetical protein
VINKQPNLDNVPLQELVANNVVAVDGNYIQYFSNNAYGNNYNSGYPRPPFAQNTYGSRPPYLPNTTYATRNNISNDLKSTIRSFIATQKELNKKFISKFKKIDVLCERVDNLTKEFTSLKNFVQSQNERAWSPHVCFW